MTRNQNQVVWLGAWLDACSLWRCYYPHVNFPGSGFYIFPQRPDYNLIAHNDVAVVQRCCTQPQFDFIQVIRQLGMKVVYELDDNVFNIPEANPAAAVLHRYKDGFRYCMQLVDTVSVSTWELAKALRTHVSKDLRNSQTGKAIPIVLAENRFDKKMFAEPVKKNELIVGWAGSSSHVGDLEIIQDQIASVALEYPHVTFEFRGCEPPGILKHLPNFRHQLWTPVAEYGVRMPLWGWSIALAPLEDHPFNAAKSCLKVMEAAYCKVPCLCSWVNPYYKFYDHDKELKWLLCDSQVQWTYKLRELINDEGRRKDLGERSYAVLSKYYSFDQPHEGWQKVFDTVRNT